ncbi:DUF4179 domain-containing protein [Paenibacillus sp. CAU 1782]
MKTNYTMLNGIKMDEKEMVEAEVSESERAALKKALRSKLKRPVKKGQHWRRNAAAAAVLLGVGATALGLTFPAYATSVPFVGDIFKLLDRGNTDSGLYDNYKENSTELNLSKTSQDITITLNDAIFDGKTTTFTFSIQSETDLGEEIRIKGFPTIKQSSGATGSQRIIKVDEGRYAGIISVSSVDHNGEDSVKVDWNIDSIVQTDDGTHKEIKGKWNFGLELAATEQTIQLVGQPAEHEEIVLAIEKIIYSPMSFTVYYDYVIKEETAQKWNNLDVELSIVDNLGNVYSGQGNGGRGIKEVSAMKWSMTKTFQQLYPEASELIVTPTLKYYNSTNENAENAGNAGEKATEQSQIEQDSGVKEESRKEDNLQEDSTKEDSQTVVLDEIVIPIEK